jgi:hypothetical protein
VGRIRSVMEQVLSKLMHLQRSPGQGSGLPRPREPASPFRHLNSPELIRLVELICEHFPL